MTTQPTMRQLPLPINAEAPRSFESFVPGHNAWVLAQLSELALRDGHGAATPVYLWGPAGCGKTHLLQSLAERVRAEGGTVGSFGPQTPLPWPLDDARSLTLLDNCDELDAAQQQAAFALFVDASSRGAQVAAAGRQPPVDLPLRDDLRTRLGWGHVLALQPLSDQDAAAVLGGEARRRGLALADDVRDHVLNHFARDLGSLMNLLERADAFALSRKRALTVPLLRQMLAEEAQAESAA